MRYLVVLLALAAGGCATKESFWVKPGSSEQDFYMDRGQCQAQAYSVAMAPPIQQARVFASCMQGKGWYYEEREINRRGAAETTPSYTIVK